MCMCKMIMNINFMFVTYRKVSIYYVIQCSYVTNYTNKTIGVAANFFLGSS